MQTTYTLDDVTIRDVAPTPVAVMEHRGDPASIGATIQRFIVWRKAAGLSPKSSPTFNVFHCDPRTTHPAEYRIDLCVGTDRPIEANGDRIEAGMIPGGRCAVLRVVGKSDNLELPRSTSIAIGCRPAARRRATFPSIVSAWPSSRKCRSMRRSRNCSCR